MRSERQRVNALAALVAAQAAAALWQVLRQRRRLTDEDLMRGLIRGDLPEHLRLVIGKQARAEVKDYLAEQKEAGNL